MTIEQEKFFQSPNNKSHYFLILASFTIIFALISIPPLAHAAEVTLAWNSSQGASGYNLYCGLASRSYDDMIDVGNNLQHTLTQLSKNQLYYCAVTAYNGSGESGYSDEISFKTKAKGGNRPHADNDGDGVIDVGDAFPSDPREWSDQDGDGVGDNSDPCPSDVSDACVVEQGPIVLYDFAEGRDNKIYDISDFGEPLDLTVGHVPAVDWIAGGGLKIHSPTVVKSNKAATKVIDAVRATNEITVEAWIKPATKTQSGPARIVTLSADPYNRNVTLGQESNRYDVRLRTTKTSTNGLPSLGTPDGSLTAQPAHVVYTRDVSGNVRIYLDTQVAASGKVDGNLSNWDGRYALALGNELTNDRPWQGEYYLLAIYDQALSPEQIKQIHAAGYQTDDTGNDPPPDDSRNEPPSDDTENELPTADAGGDQTADEGDTLILDGAYSSDPDDGIATFRWEQTQGTPVDLSDSSAIEPRFVCPQVGPDGDRLTFRLTVIDYSGATASDTVTIQVNDIAGAPPDIPEIEYCEAASTTNYPLGIVKVTWGSFSNSSSSDGYSDFTTEVIEVEKAQIYSLSLSATPAFKKYLKYWRGWADLNHDGDFDDPGEKLFEVASTDPLSGQITFPAAALEGHTRLRIAMGFYGYLNPCGDFTIGEVEDYTLRVVN